MNDKFKYNANMAHQPEVKRASCRPVDQLPCAAPFLGTRFSTPVMRAAGRDSSMHVLDLPGYARVLNPASLSAVGSAQCRRLTTRQAGLVTF